MQARCCEMSWMTESANSYCFCIADVDSDAHEPCPEQPPSGDMFDLMKSAGGFTVSLEDARAQLTERSRRGD